MIDKSQEAPPHGRRVACGKVPVDPGLPTARGSAHDQRNVGGRVMARAVKNAKLKITDELPAPTFHCSQLFPWVRPDRRRMGCAGGLRPAGPQGRRHDDADLPRSIPSEAAGDLSALITAPIDAGERRLPLPLGSSGAGFACLNSPRGARPVEW